MILRFFRNSKEKIKIGYIKYNKMRNVQPSCLKKNFKWNRNRN